MRPHPRFTPAPADATGRRGDRHEGHDPYLQHRPGNHGCDHKAEPDPSAQGLKPETPGTVDAPAATRTRR